MKEPEARKYIAVDESLLDDLRTVLAGASNELARGREREAALRLEVERNKPINEQEAAEYLGKDSDTLRYYRTLGLDSFKKGGSRWYTKGIIDEWLATGRVRMHKR